VRKIFCSIFIIFCICFAASCSNKSETLQYEQTEDDYHIYNIDKDIRSYDISDNNEIYYITSVENPKYETTSIISGKEYKISIPETQLYILDSDGEIQNSYILPATVSKICLDGEIIYYIYSKGNDLYALAKYSPETQTSVPICNIENYTLIKEMEIVNDEIYFIGIHNDYTDTDYTLADINDNYSYSGERIGCVNLNTGTVEEVSVDFPIFISDNPDDSHLVIYAYDEKNGYYFTVYDTKTKSFSDRTFRDLGMYTNFDVYDTSNNFIYFKSTTAERSLAAATLSSDEGESELLPVKYVNDIKCSKDYIYFIDYLDNMKKIIRKKFHPIYREIRR
jgi:hypothetical protein